MRKVRDAGANQPKVIRCYNYKGECHIAKPCIAKKRVKDSEWFKDKMLLAQAQEERAVLHEEEQYFLADSLEENDNYCDDEATTNAIFMANLSLAGSLNDDTIGPTYDSNTLSEYMVTIKDKDAHYVPLLVQDKNMMVFVIEQMKSQVEKCTTVNQEAKSVNESLTCELEKYKARVKALESGYNSK
ncbi:hypothetical protein Tco_1346166 [Tanacetum coccineum]